MDSHGEVPFRFDSYSTAVEINQKPESLEGGSVSQSNALAGFSGSTTKIANELVWTQKTPLGSEVFRVLW